MSQAKVDKYKKEKANRKKEMAKQKTEKIIGIICGCAILVAISFLRLAFSFLYLSTFA